MAHEPFSDETAKLLRAAWFRYLDTVGETRPALYRYCRRMTGNIWDAEDLLQETLLRGFGTIGRGDVTSKAAQVKGPRAYLFRIATNLWIDQVRRRQLLTSSLSWSDDSATGERSIQAREAASILMSRVAPRERAAVVLKEVFDFTLAQIAEILSTTVGAVKSALHRGRARLEEMPSMRPTDRAPSKELLDRFVAALNARDVAAVTDLLLDSTTLDVCGVGSERRKAMNHYRVSFENAKGAPGRAEAVSFEGEWLLVVWGGVVSNEVLINVERLEEEAGHIAHIRSYYFCPEVIAEIAGEIGAQAWASPHGQNQPPHTQSQIAASAILPWS
jgi:RNA polymerase sigma-70 factor, ECF subfamily